MPVARGEPWGESGTLPVDGLIYPRDCDAARAVQFTRARGLERPEMGLIGGDLWRTLGAPIGGADRLRNGPATRVTVDVGWITMGGDEVEHCFVAHCVARTRLWSQVLAVMNAEWLGEWDVAPRSHPGDGWMDVTEAALGWADRQKVRERLATGTHLPHPGMRTSRIRESEFEFRDPLRLYLDGSAFPKVRRLKVRVEPASLTVVV
ncbi:MAG: hypothetical protein KY395_00430 [Actinobacteria bacterium]|nr:hypothetical protein [Actinomycetota bacterium]